MRAQTRRSIMLLPGVKPWLCPLLRGKSSTAWLLAGCHAPVPTAPTRPLAAGLSCPPRFPLQVAGSRSHVPFALPRFPQGIPDAPAHTHEASLVSRSVTPPPLAAPHVTADFCRRGKRPRQGWVLMRCQVACTLLRWLPWCTHPQKRKAAGRAVAPGRLTSCSSTQWCYAASVAGSAHPVTRWSRQRGADPAGQARPAERTASCGPPLTQWPVATPPGGHTAQR